MTATQPTGRKQAAKNISIYAVGTVIRQLAAFIMLPVYTNFLSPADYGVVALLVLMLSLFELTLGGRFIQAVPKFYYDRDNEERRKAVISTALFLTALVSIVSVSCLFYFSDVIARLAFDSVDYTMHVQLYCIVLLTAALEEYGLTYFRIQEKPVVFVVNSVAKLVLQLGLNIYFVVYLELGVIGVVYSAIISSSAFGLFAVGYILYYNGASFEPGLTKRFFKFSWPLWLAGLAGLYVGSSSQAYIKIFSDLSDVGLFELANKFAMILAMLIWAPFGQWWQTERFKLYHSEDRGIGTFPVVFNVMAIILCFTGLGIIVFSGVVIEIMASEAFGSSVKAIPFLVTAVIFNQLTNFFKFSFLVAEKTLILTYIGYGSALTLTLLLILLVPDYGFIGAAIAVMVNNILIFFSCSFFSRKYFDSNIRFLVFVKLMCTMIVCISGNYWLSESGLSLLWEVQLKLVFIILFLIMLVQFVSKDKKLHELFGELFLFFKNRISAKSR